jgi:cytosine/adenosine deaminase-related metal-dependent hydrolase
MKHPVSTSPSPRNADLLIRGAYALTMDGALGNVPDADILIRDGRLVAIGQNVGEADAADVIDARSMIALPGLIETHWHMWGSLARNMAGEDVDSGYFPLSRVLGTLFTPDDNARGVRLALAEALFSGVTTVHNWSHNLLEPAFADAELQAHTEIGSRARFSYGYSRRTGRNAVLPHDDIKRVQRQWFGSSATGLLTLGIAPGGPMASSIEICARDWAFAREIGIPITTHVAINPAGVEHIGALGAAGLLGPDVQLIHAVHASDRDIALLAETGTHVSLSPYTEMRTGFGFPPIGEMLDAGVLISLSIDTPILCGHADMFATMRGMQNIENGRKQSEFALTASRVLRMATIDGARALGLDVVTGSLTVGKRADLILVRTTDLNMAPFTDPVRMIVQSAQPHNVDTVIVDGRVLKRGGRLTTIDVDRVVREAGETMAKVKARIDAGEAIKPQQYFLDRA